jgi:filamentous hemagglutinin
MRRVAWGSVLTRARADTGLGLDDATVPTMAAAGFAMGMAGNGPGSSGAGGETRFINGVTVIDKKTGNVLQGTVDLKPTLDRISAGKNFHHKNDGSVFGNKEGLLPQQPARYYKEYVHPTPGVNGPGPQR